MSILKTIKGALDREKLSLEERMERDRLKLAIRHQKWEHDYSIRERYAGLKTATGNAQREYEKLCAEIDKASRFDMAAQSMMVIHAGVQLAGQTAINLAKAYDGCKTLSEISNELKEHLHKHQVEPAVKAEQSFYEQHKKLLNANPLPKPQEPPVPVSQILGEDHYSKPGPSREIRSALGIYPDGKVNDAEEFDVNACGTNAIAD